MKHYLKNKEGDVKYTVDMYCGWKFNCQCRM